MKISEIENKFLGYYLTNPEDLPFLERKPKPELFANPLMGQLFKALLNAPKGHGAFEIALKLGIPMQLISKLMSEGPVSENMQFWSDQLTNMQVATYAKKMSHEKATVEFTAETCKEYLDGFEKDFQAYQLLREQSDAIVPWKTALKEWVKELDAKSSGDFKPIYTGFDRLDDVIDGLHPMELYIIAARTGGGKSGLLKSIMVSALKKDPSLSVLFFSVEMGYKEIISRIASEWALVDSKKFRKGELNESEFDRLYKQFISNADDLNITFTQIQAVSLYDIISIAKAVKIKSGIDLIVVDYIQRIPSHNPKISRLDNLNEITFGLKKLSQDMNCPVAAAAQVGRKPENEKRVHYQLSDIADCGGIENDADTIIFIERPGKYDMAIDPADARLVVKKNRHGEENCNVEVEFQGKYAAFKPKGNG